MEETSLFSTMDGFDEFSAMTVSQNRCAGFTASGKRCRTRLKDDQYLYCCEAHKPVNTDCLEEGCVCCMEKLINHKDALHFRCNHVVHRECYYEWMKGCTEESPVCIVCREPVWTALQPKRRPVTEYIPPEGFSATGIKLVLDNIMKDMIIYKEEAERQKKKRIFSDTILL
jgi:hypothetical protein